MNVIKLHQDRPVTAANVVWENPPSLANRAGKYADFTQALRENPGQWAVITTLGPTEKRRAWGMSNSINAAKLVDFRDDQGRFEATCRSGNSETRVYVRYLPQAVQVAR